MINFVCEDPPEEHNKMSLDENGDFKAAGAHLSKVAVTQASFSPSGDIPLLHATFVTSTGKIHKTAESLSSSGSKKNVFDRLGAKVNEDLQRLATPGRESCFTDPQRLSQLQQSDNRKNLPDLRTKLSRESSTMPRGKEHEAHSALKPVYCPSRDEKQKVQLLTKPLPVPPVSSSKPKSPRVETISKNAIKYDPRSVVKSITAYETSESIENKERLADKYNPRPQKTSNEVQNKKVLGNQKIDKGGSKISFLENIIPNKENNIINKIPSDIVINKPKENMSGSWFGRNNPNFESQDKTNPMSALLPSSDKQPMINNTPRGEPFMQPSSSSSNVQDPYAAYNQMTHGSNQMVLENNQMARQKELMANQNKFIPPQQNLMNQNIPASYGGNNYMNSFVLQNNVSNNISHIQHENPFNVTPNTFYNEITPANSVYPHVPIESNSGYDLSKMPPINFYPFTCNQIPMNYANCPPYSTSFAPRGRPPYNSRPKFNNWRQRNKGQWHQRRNHASHLSRDPRIRANEIKEKTAQSNIKEPPTPSPQIQRRIDEHSRVDHTKYDAAYTNLGCGKGKQETFVSPLESLYATGEAPQKTGRGYGLQKFRIPKKKSDIGGRYHNERKEEEKTESCKEIPQEISQRVKNQVTGITLKQQESVTSEKKEEKKLEKDENIFHPTPTVSQQSSTSTNGKKHSNEHVKDAAFMIAGILKSFVQSSDNEHLLSALYTSLRRSEPENKKFKMIQKIVDSDTDDEHEEPVKKKAEETGFQTKSKQHEKIIKEKQTKEETTTAEVKVEAKTIGKKEIKAVEKEDIPNEEDEGDEDKENKGNGKVLKSPEISLRKRKRRGGRKKMQKGEVLQSKQTQKAIKVNIKNKKKVYAGAKLEENVIETVGERIKIKRRPTKTPEPTKAHKFRTELDKLHKDIEATDKRMCPILKGDSEEAVKTNGVSASNFRNRRTSSTHEENVSVLDSPKRQSRSESLETTRLRPRTRQMNRRKSCVDTEGTTSNSNSFSLIKRTISKRNLTSKPNYREDTDEELSPPMSDPEEEPFKQEELQTDSIQKEVVGKKGETLMKIGQNWASSITRKIPKKKLHSNTTTLMPSVDGNQLSMSVLREATNEPMPQEDNESDTELIEPDKSYYFDPQDKSECKLCSFKGKMIVQHYKTKHSKHEVLISRIAPDNANTAIEESIENGYEDIKVTDAWETKHRKKKFTYRCRFCQVLFKNENSENFFNHLTGHTGEYRFNCRFCSFKTANGNSLRSHMYWAHSSAEHSDSIMPTYRAPPNCHMVFGYICAKCNFIQMDKTTIEAHMNIYHQGKNEKIYKINMSTVVSKPTDVSEEQAPAEVGEQVNKKQMERQVEQNHEKPESQDQELQLEAVEEVIIEDLTVFKPITEYAQEVIELDELQHEKTKEMYKTIIHCNEVNLLNSTADAIASTSKKNLLQEGSDSKKAKSDARCSMESNVEKPIVNKTSVPISPTLLPSNEFEIKIEPLNKFEIKIQPEEEEVAARVGPVGATKENGYVLYTCYTQSCIFSSAIQSEFAIHCKNLHGNKLWDGFCNICNINTHLTEVEEAYGHLLSMHNNDFEDDDQRTTTELSESQNEVKYLHMRRLSGDRLSENRLSDTNNANSVILTSDESYCKIASGMSQHEEVLENTYSLSSHISNVTTLMQQQEQSPNTPESAPPTTAVENVLPAIIVMNSVAGAGGITAVSSPTTSPIAVPFPFQSTSESEFVLPRESSPTIASTPTSKLASPVKAKGRLMRLKLKDTPLQPYELEVPRKTSYAMTCFLSEQKLVHLYKCPERNCTYSTDSKKQFESHIHQHIEFNSGMQIPCLYCNFKTDFDYIGVHYDIKHGRCRYCCVYCLYRGRVQSYVEMHQEREHSKSVRQVMMVPINPDALKSRALISLPPLKNVIPLYECGQRGCLKKFIFSDDFGEHLRSAHTIPPICFCCQYKATTSAALIDHMTNHNVCYYHCRYCMLGGTTMEDIYKHLSQQHFAMPPRIVFRRFCPGESMKRRSDFALDSPELMEHMKLYSIEDDKYITPNARFEMTLTTTSKELAINKNPIMSESSKAALQNNEKEPATLYKDQKETENYSHNSADVEIIQVSDDETSVALKDVNSGQALPKTLVNSVTTASPIILNKYPSSPKKPLTLPQYLPSSTAPPTIVETKPKTEAILLDKLTAEDVDSLRFVPEACSTRIDENTGDVKTETNLDFMDNCSYSDYEAVQECPEEVSFSVENMTKKEGLIHRHNVTNLTKELKKYNYDENKFVVRPKLIKQKSTNSSHEISSNASYANDEANKQFYLTGKEVPVPAIAPFNPVPCLKKNENVVSKIEKKERSGLVKAEDAQLPVFVPATKRYVCGVDYCNRPCLEESALRNHLQASHSDESVYRCQHCLEKLSSEKGVINVDNIIKHLRIHALHLYKCSDCEFSHSLKQQVEKHVCDKRRDKLATVAIVRETHEPKKTHHKQQEGVKETKPWRCGMCEYQCSTKNKIIAHVHNKHRNHKKYKCILCRFRSNKIAAFSNHFQTYHPGVNIDVVHAYYQVEATSVSSKKSRKYLIHDTTPLLPEWDENQLPKKSPAKGFNSLSKSEVNSEVIKIEDDSENENAMTEIEEMEISELRNTGLYGTYGPYGKPFKELFVCPSCPRNHLQASHSDESVYRCQHCLEKLSSEKGVINVDNIIKHLQLHGLHLYKCSDCEFSHSLKQQVEKHVCDKHTDKPATVIIVQHEQEKQYHKQHEGVKETRSWRCGMCEYQCLAKREIIAHIHNKHHLSKQYKCNLCKFGSNKIAAFSNHFQTAHAGLNTDVVHAYYHVEASVSSKESLEDHQRQHCNRNYKAASNMRNHDWVQKPLKCGYCDMGGITNCEVTEHSKRAHPTMEASVVAVPTSSTSTVKRAMRKRKYPTCAWRMSSSNKVQAKQPALEIREDPVALVIEEQFDKTSNKPKDYICEYCGMEFDVRQEIVDHHMAVHSHLELDLPPDLTMQSFQCHYCSYRNSYTPLLRRHQKEEHPDLEFKYKSVQKAKNSSCRKI